MWNIKLSRDRVSAGHMLGRSPLHLIVAPHTPIGSSGIPVPCSKNKPESAGGLEHMQVRIIRWDPVAVYMLATRHSGGIQSLEAKGLRTPAVQLTRPAFVYKHAGRVVAALLQLGRGSSAVMTLRAWWGRAGVTYFNLYSNAAKRRVY